MMHEDQVEVTAAAVAGLVAERFPDWAGLPVRPVASDGTVNALFRLGDEFVLRFPLRPGDGDARAELVREQDAARLLAGRVPVRVPEPVALGAPGAGYPGWWSVFRWIAGEPVDAERLPDPDGLARDLAGFVVACRSIDTGGRVWSGRGRGGPLRVADDGVRAALAASAGLVDTARLAELARVWERCRDVPRGDTPDVWLHADLMPGNLLADGGRLAAVIDLGTVTVGDPAVDLMVAWNLLPAGARETFRRAVGVDGATWERGRGWALRQAIVALPYYRESNPAMAATARRTLDAVLS